MCGLKVIGYAKDCVWILILIDIPIGFIHILYNIYLNEKYKQEHRKSEQYTPESF